MSADLVECGLLLGRNRAEVIDFLGEPDDASTDHLLYLFDTRANQAGPGVWTMYVLVKMDSVKQEVLDAWITD